MNYLQLTESRDVMRIAMRYQAQVVYKLRLMPKSGMTTIEKTDAAVLDYVLRTLNAQAHVHIDGVASGVENPESVKFLTRDKP